MSGPGRSSFLLPTAGGEAVVTLRRNARRLSMRVDPETGQARISAPHHVTNAQLESFVASHAGWLLEYQASARLRSPELLRTGGRAALWGRWTELVVTDGLRAVAVVREGRIHITRPPDDEAAARRALTALRGRELAAVVSELLERWVPRFGIGPEKVQYKDMRTRWGSCTRATRRMSLNTRLAALDPAATEYVLVHEMVHLLHPNHGPAFQRALSEHLPDWREREKHLKMVP